MLMDARCRVQQPWNLGPCMAQLCINCELGEDVYIGIQEAEIRITRCSIIENVMLCIDCSRSVAWENIEPRN
jgi:hypothetical protein